MTATATATWQITSYAHAPATHAVPGPQTFPHAPQFAGSRCVSTQLLPQRTCPLTHAHLPAEQVAPPLHAALQAPQCRLFVSTSTQALLQLVSPGPQVTDATAAN